jgi:PKD repeat protein
MMKTHPTIVSVIFLCLISWDGFSQCPAIPFSLTPSCAGTPVQATPSSTSASTYFWDFCAGEVLPANLAVQNTWSGSAWTANHLIKAVTENNRSYLFSSRSTLNNLRRINLGTNPENNNPAILSSNSTNSLFTNILGFNLIKDNNRWAIIGFSAADNTLRRFMIDSLNYNTFSGQIIGNYNLSNILDMAIVNDNGQFIALCPSQTQNTLKLIRFGSSILNNPPPADTLTISGFPGVYSLSSIAIVKECNEWIAFLATSGSTAKLYRIHFGAVLFDNLFTLQDITPAGIGSIQQIQLIQEGGFWKAILASNLFSFPVYQLQFSSGLNGPVTLSSSTSVGVSYHFATAIASGSNWYLFALKNGNSTTSSLLRLKFNSSCQASPATSSMPIPPPVLYSSSTSSARITLSAVLPSGTVNTSQTIPIHPTPEANFSTTYNCIGSTTQFQNLTGFQGSLSNVQWNWQLGNGLVSSQFSPSTIYPSIDSFTVRLVATTQQGCADSITKRIFVSEVPTANFTYETNCEGDSSFFFNQSSYTIDSISETNWIFGNSITSLAQHPVLILPFSGNVNTRLIVTNTTGCKDTAEQTIFIKDSPDLTVNVTNTCLGDTVQLAATILFEDTTTAVSVNWNLGDGTAASGLNVSHAYAPLVQDYYTQLEATGSNGCSDTLSTLVHIATPPVANFSFPTICAHSPVTFSQQCLGSSDPVIRWLWTFPSQVDTSPSPTYIFNTEGNFPVQLVAVSPTWCTDTIQQIVPVLPTPIVEATGDTVCFGQGALLSGIAQIDTPFTLSQTIWFPGDGAIDTNLINLHQYAQIGPYMAILEITASNGCKSRDTTNIQVKAVPRADFSVSVACALAPAKLINSSTIPAPDQITSYQWQWGNGFSSSVFDTSLAFPSPGIHPVTLIVMSSNGCRDTMTRDIDVFEPLQASYSLSSVCAGDSIRFTDETASISIVSRVWDFGDNSPFRFEENPSYLYTQPGIYNVILQVENAIGCIDTGIRSIEIYQKPVADFNPLSACLGAPITFNDQTEYFSSQAEEYRWTVDSTVSIQPAPQYSFTQSGNYPVSLFVRSAAGCTDSTEKIITIHPKPDANFTVQPEYGSPPLDVQFSATGTHAGSWLWDFGDGNIDSGQATVHTYTQNDTFTATLYAFSTAGCSDTGSRSLFIIPTNLDLAVAGVETEQIAAADGSINSKTTVVFYNAGTRIITHIEWQATLGPSASLTENWSGLLYPGSIQSFTFVSRFRTTDRSRQTYVCVNALQVNEGQTELSILNNTQCTSLDAFVQIIGPRPNPAEENCALGVVLQEPSGLTLAIIDESGRIVSEEVYSLDAGINEISLPVSRWSRGLYFLRIRVKDEEFYRKIYVNQR